MSSDTSPTARALRTLEILGTRPGATASELAGRLGVTERAARRYVGILREAGIPVTSARGPHGGYRLGRGTRLPPVSFTQSEALGLVMAVINGDPDAGGDDLVDAALGKVVRALPADVGRQAATLRAHASATPDRYATRPDTAVTGELVAAIAARRRVVVTYRGETGRQWVAEVDPWAVVVRYGRWYLLCHSHRSDAVRTYRVDRVLDVAHTGHGFVPPDDLDPVAALEEHLGIGWRFTTRVVFDAPLADVEPWVGAHMGRLEAAGDRCVLTGSTRNPEAYAQERLARVPFGYRVEGGPELREAVAVLAERLTAALTGPAARPAPVSGGGDR
ncbi:helix-turn-helix transcriptional regulator [Myceligenerans indicum]|uniref:WYL domain-containing protein n=1 Tax=Myceligenerans indicum TaxID=2593663 RepID=A0ABS1LHS0_9MICO|nr:WYL domain-containing protein [Myceligenerans indicum]MBL0885122.1 WYL domain-containing protein [Myceligenerans indicum]